MIRFGTHCSLREGLTGALREAERNGCSSVQIFTRSPRMWKMRPPAPREAEEFRTLRRELDIRPLVVHTPYLPNLATSAEALYALSVDSLVKDLEVSEALAADYLVIHPGSYSPGASAAEGIGRIADAMNRALEQVPGRVVVLLENVAGGGRRLGASFEELAAMLQRIRRKERLGVCFDTAHALGAGYDVSTAAGVARTLGEFDRLLGLERLKVVHCNDSLVPRGSRRDRHQHLGRGYVGEKGFRALLRRLRNVAGAGILETPKDSPDADARNLRLLRRWSGDGKAGKPRKRQIDKRIGK